MSIRRNRIGEVHNYLTVIELARINKTKNSIWRCKCVCGNIADILDTDMVSGRTESCGCVGRKHQREACTKHGHTKGVYHGGRVSTTYTCWMSMKQRCYDPKATAFERYGGKGITVCERWRYSFENFLTDMGEQPKGMEIDRYPNQNGNYEPSNCRWATEQEQANNRSSNVLLTFNGITQTATQWARALDIPVQRIYSRLKAGLSHEQILNR